MWASPSHLPQQQEIVRESICSLRARLAIAAGVLFVGGLVYLTRPTDPVAFAWLDRIGLEALADVLRLTRHVVSLHVSLPSWIRGSASDATYAFAIGAVFADSRGAALATAFIVAIGHELLQSVKLAPGTFDVFDLIALSASFALAILLFRARAVRVRPQLDLPQREPS
jgi:hypothetical protein